jgi:prevent-host-death family protein
MRTVGIQEVRRHLRALLDEVRKGRRVVITDHGKPIACLSPAPDALSPRPFRSRRRFRATIRLAGEPLSRTISDDRRDR